jgi:SNF2 family DNA or RNA helicase
MASSSFLPFLSFPPSHSTRCPIFKVLTYYGSAKARKALRTGWSKLNSFHICITSYQLVVQDANSFRRKRWYYMALDEAHNIKVC